MHWQVPYLRVSGGVQQFDGVKEQLGDGGSLLASLGIGEQVFGESVEEHAAGNGERVQGVVCIAGICNNTNTLAIKTFRVTDGRKHSFFYLIIYFVTCSYYH